METTISDEIPSSYFIEEWLNNFNIAFVKDIKIPRSSGKLDYLLMEQSLGILIVDWKKPISVKVVNKAICAIDHKLGVDKIYIVCREISNYALSLIGKLNYNIEIVHPFGLSEIALTFVQFMQKRVPVHA